jgi:hypothetical protein
MITSVLFGSWIATSAALITAGDRLDGWMDDKPRHDFAVKLTARLRADPKLWAHSVNQVFLTIFDWFYCWRRPRLASVFWRGILCSYAVLLIARLDLYCFGLRVPRTEAILFIAVIVSLLMGLFSEALLATASLGRTFRDPSEVKLRDLGSNRDLITLFLCGAAAYGFSVGTIAVVTLHMRSVSIAPIAMSIGTAVAFCAALLMFRAPTIVVSPIRAFASSLLTVVVLSAIFKSATSVFLNTFRASGWMVITYIAFNFFGDAISLVETRWVLRRSRGAAVMTIAGLLVVDLIASAAVYLALPELANESFSTLWDGIWLRGSQPWLGILFWSTFATSAVFYVFVLAVLLLKVLTPVVRTINFLDNWLSLYEHPARFLSVSTIIIITIGFLGVVLMG